MRNARRIDRVSPGWFRMRMVRGGPFVAARIFLPCPIVPCDPDIDPFEWCRHYDRSRQYLAEIDGEAADVMRVWTGAETIRQAEWQYLTDAANWDRVFSPASPAANPRKPVNLRQVAPVF